MLLSVGVLDAADEALGNIGVAVERGFDTLRLDADPANFDLVVHSAHEDDVAIGQVVGEIAGPVQAGGPVATEGIGDELSCRERGVIQIAASDGGAADTEFADNADGNGAQVRVENVALGVPDRFADHVRRDHSREHGSVGGVGRRLPFHQDGKGAVHGRLRGPVKVHDAVDLRIRGQLREEAFAGKLRADADDPDRFGKREVAQEVVEDGRGGAERASPRGPSGSKAATESNQG